MLVEELIEELRRLPATAHVDVEITSNVTYDGLVVRTAEEDWRTEDIIKIDYEFGVVILRLG